MLTDKVTATSWGGALTVVIATILARYGIVLDPTIEAAGVSLLLVLAGYLKRETRPVSAAKHEGL